MYRLDFNKKAHIHFIGIGGISMSGLAEILLQKGFEVSGSDAKESELTETLKSAGAQVMIGQKAENIREGIDAVVYTAAIRPDNEEFMAAQAAGLAMLTRAELLGQIMKNYKEAITISGTHGKTTTTSMISEICMAAELDPTISVGGMLQSIGGNIRIGGPDCFIAEACEYTNSFLSFFPTTEVILNVKADHLDFFKDIDDIRRSFTQFASLLPETGLLVINGEIERVEEITSRCRARIVTYGIPAAEKKHAFEQKSGAKADASFDYEAANISYDENACGSFDVKEKGALLGRFSVKVPGEHNVSNALAAVAVARSMGIFAETIQKGFSHYTGVDRRFQKKGEREGFLIYDDYAHHPDEIRATLTMARQVAKGKLWCVFQPHTYSRTKALLPEFCQALSLADEVILADIYAAREKDTLGISSRNVADGIAALGTPARFLKSFEEIEEFLPANCRKGDLVITMGAGDIVKVGENLLKG